MSRFLRRVEWYSNRLTTMSAAEIAHRVEEQAKRAISRIHNPRLKLGRMADAPLPGLPGLAEGVSALAQDEQLLTRWQKVAQRATRGQFRALGQEWPNAPGESRWHVDPVTLQAWPNDRYCFDISYRDAVDIGDVKFIWEINRLQYLHPIAALAAVKEDRDLATFCAGEIESWIDENPPFQGVNWASGIELALRIVSILVVTSLLGKKAFNSFQREKLWASLAAHGYWLMRFPSRFSSANNHLIAEAGGLFLLGCLAPGLAGAQRWARYGRDTLQAEVLKQIHSDGVGAEQSPTYTAFVLEWLLLCGHVAKQTGHPFLTTYWKRIEKAAEFLRWITDTRGNQPRIGDDDEGRVFYSQLTPEPYVSSVLRCIAAATGREDLAPPVTEPHLRDACFGAIAAASSGPTGVRTFETGGYTVVRWARSETDCMFVMDHGPLGYLSICAHGHADALSLWLHLDGQPVVVDAGTFLYHAGGAWRDHFRGTAAHNTLSVSGQNSSRISGPFNWSSKAKTTLLRQHGDLSGWLVEAEHDGFLKQSGIIHRRQVKGIGSDILAITDLLRGGQGTHAVEVGFLLHPKLGLRNCNESWLVHWHNRPILRIDHQGCLGGKVQEGVEAPPRGWYSPAFAEKQTAKRLVFAGELAVDEPCCVTLTVL